jgi:hypothetical protein
VPSPLLGRDETPRPAVRRDQLGSPVCETGYRLALPGIDPSLMSVVKRLPLVFGRLGVQLRHEAPLFLVALPPIKRGSQLVDLRKPGGEARHSTAV